MEKKYILHYHTNTLFEELTEVMEKRIQYVKDNKPPNQTPTHFRLMHVLTDEEMRAMPQEAWKAWKKWKELDKMWESRHKNRIKAQKEWKERVIMRRKAIKALRKEQSAPAMMKWHRKVCKPDCPWNGRRLVSV